MVEGDLKIERRYWDEENKTFVNINMSVRDHTFLDYLKKLESAIRSIR